MRNHAFKADNPQSDGESEGEEEGGKGEAKELTLLQIMERRQEIVSKQTKKATRQLFLIRFSFHINICINRQASTTVIDILRDEEDFRVNVVFNFF